MSAERNTDAILRARAERLAAKPLADKAPGIQVLLCVLGSERVGLPLEALAHIAPFRQPAPLPGAATSALGVIARAGAFFQLYDLNALHGQPAARAHAHIAFLRRRTPQAALAIAHAENIAEVTPLSAADAADTGLDSTDARLARAPDGRIISILDIDTLLAAVAPPALYSKGDVA